MPLGGRMPTSERGLDGVTTEYSDVALAGDGVERLLTELFTEALGQAHRRTVDRGGCLRDPVGRAPHGDVARRLLDGRHRGLALPSVRQRSPRRAQHGAGAYSSRGPRRLLPDRWRLVRVVDLGTPALERARRADDHDPVPERALRRELAASGGASVGEDGALGGTQTTLRRRLSR